MYLLIHHFTEPLACLFAFLSILLYIAAKSMPQPQVVLSKTERGIPLNKKRKDMKDEVVG